MASEQLYRRYSSEHLKDNAEIFRILPHYGYSSIVCKDRQDVSKDEIAAVWQYEHFYNTPSTFTAYIGERVLIANLPVSKDPLWGRDETLGSRWEICTWHGLPFAVARLIGRRYRDSYISSHEHYYRMEKWGRTWSGRGAGKGMAVTFYETAASRKRQQPETYWTPRNNALIDFCRH